MRLERLLIVADRDHGAIAFFVDRLRFDLLAGLADSDSGTREALRRITAVTGKDGLLPVRANRKQQVRVAPWTLGHDVFP